MTKLSKTPARRPRQQSQPVSKANGSHANGKCAASSVAALDSPRPTGGVPSEPAFGSPGENGLAHSPAPAREDLLHDINAKITNAAPRIVEKIIEHAEEHASYLHAKFLFDFAGLNAAPAPASNSAEHSLAALLLRTLEVPVAPPPSAPAEQPSAPAHPTELRD
jgi:hypothetical protein